MTSRVRVLFGGAVLLALALTLLGSDVILAQQPGKYMGMVVVPLGATQPIQMTSKKPLKQPVLNKAGPLQVTTVAGDPTRLMLTGIQVDQVHLTLTDMDGAVEEYDVVIQIDVEYLKTQLRAASQTANVTPTTSGNTVILNGYVKHAAEIDTLIGIANGLPNVVVKNNLRIIGVQQVQIDVVVAQVSRNKARSMAFNFQADTKNFFLASTVGQAATNPTTTGVGGAFSTFPTLLGTPGSPGGVPTNLLSGVIHSSWGILTFLEALKQEGVAKIVAQPRLTCMSGQQASFLTGGEQAIPVPAGLGQVGVQFEEFGTRLNVVPVVLGDGKIHLSIEPEISNLNAANGTVIDGTTVPGRNTSRINTTVELESGQTFVLGGLIQHEVSGSLDKVPVLGDLPFIGAFWSSKSYTETDTELVILVTPHLVDALDCRQVPDVLPGEETRSPDDFELFLEQILEAPRGPRQVFVDHHYVAPYKNSPTAAEFPCAGGRCVGGNCGGGNCATGNCGAVGVTNSCAARNVAAPMTQPPAPPAPPPPPPARVQQPTQLPQSIPQATATPPVAPPTWQRAGAPPVIAVPPGEFGLKPTPDGFSPQQ